MDDDAPDSPEPAADRWVDGDLLRCSFCGRAQQQVRKLIAGPGVYICEGCVVLARQWPGTGEAQARCSFCSMSRATVRRPVAEGHVVCDVCLDLCDEIKAEETGEA